jgi:hypothetical protein
MTITLTREEAQQVLGYLEEIHPGNMTPMAEINWSKAIETFRARLSAPEPEYRDVVIKGDLWRIEFLPDHAASVVLVRANYEAQPEPEPVAWMQSDMEHFSLWIDEWHTIPLYPAPLKRDFKFSTIEEAKQPMPTPVGKPQLTDDESRFADAFTTLLKVGYGKEAEIVLKCKPRWQGLTDAEMMDLELSAHDLNSVSIIALRRFGRAIESKLKEKNT